MRLATRPAARLLLPALAVAGALVVAACASSGPTPAPVASSVPASTEPASSPAGSAGPAVTAVPESPTLTPVPGGETVEPGPVGTPIPTTVTDWGTILDDLPASFPRYPDMGVADVPDGPYTATFDAPADVDTLAEWYRDEFTNRGWSVELGSALEDGSRVLDAQADLPECRVQMTFRPGDGSTIMTVLEAAACVTGVEG